MFHIHNKPLSKKVILVIFVFCLYCLFMSLFLFTFREQTELMLNSKFGDGTYGSLVSSFFDSSLFFVLVSAVTLIISLKSPSDEQFEVRIASVANNAMTENGNYAVESLIKNIKEMLLFAKTFETTITITEIAEKEGKQYAYLHVFHRSFLVNMCKDITYTSDNFYLKVIPGEKVLDKFGKIYEVSLLKFHDKRQPEEIRIVERPKKIVSKKAKSVWVEETIEKGGAAELRSKYAIWVELTSTPSKDNEDAKFGCGTNKFADNAAIDIINTTDTEIEVHMEYRDFAKGTDKTWFTNKPSKVTIPKKIDQTLDSDGNESDEKKAPKDNKTLLINGVKMEAAHEIVLYFCPKA